MPVFGLHTLLDPRVAGFLWTKGGLKKINLDLGTWQAHVTIWTNRVTQTTFLWLGKSKKSWNLQLFTILGLEAPP